MATALGKTIFAILDMSIILAAEVTAYVCIYIYMYIHIKEFWQQLMATALGKTIFAILDMSIILAAETAEVTQF